MNIQLDLVITDTYGGKPEKKTVSMVVQGEGRGSIRTSGEVRRADGNDPVQLNMDASARVIRENLIEVGVNFQYLPGTLSVSALPRAVPTSLVESINVVVRNGKPLLVSRSADPVSDRTVTVELTATIREQ